MEPNLLIVEDDPGLADMLTLHFEEQGFVVTHTDLVAQARTLAAQQDFDLALLDQQLPDGEGIGLLPQLLAAQPNLPVIMMTGAHDLQLAIEAISLGAAEFVHKPLDTKSLQASVDKVLASSATKSQSQACELPQRELIGRSSAMLEVSKQIALCAQSKANVLLNGESGTGKEVVARLIHQHSARQGEFIAVNCAAIVDNLLESELFGHEKGAFTGADKVRIGRFEQAHGGTLLLDEIGEMSLALQAKLLRVLQERQLERVGGNRSITVDVRIIAATHRDLLQLVEQGQFRQDLAYRLNVVQITLPPLRERLEDIPLLAPALLAKVAAHNDQAPPRIDAQALNHLQQHAWPGNVRELENLLTEALVLARGQTIGIEHLQFRQAASAPISATDPAQTLRSLQQVEAEHIQKVLMHTGGHKGRSCEILGISRPALDRKIVKYALKLH